MPLRHTPVLQWSIAALLQVLSVCLVKQNAKQARCARCPRSACRLEDPAELERLVAEITRQAQRQGEQDSALGLLGSAGRGTGASGGAGPGVGGLEAPTPGGMSATPSEMSLAGE